MATAWSWRMRPRRCGGLLVLGALALLALALTVLAGPRPTLAHPHVWIKGSVELIFAGREIRAMEVTWTLDDLYSTLVREDFDADGDGVMNEAELAEVVRMQLEEDLAPYSYFTHLTIGGERLRVTEVENFRARFEDDLLSFTFMVQMPKAVDPTKTEFAFGLYDEEYFIEFGLYGEDAIRMSGDAETACKPIVGTDPENPIYFGVVDPMKVTLSCHVG